MPDDLDRDGLAAAFRHEYRSRYHREGPAVEPEIITWRVVSSGPTPKLELRRPLDPADGGPSVSRPAFFGDAGGFVQTEVRSRASIAPGEDIEGPVIVEEDESTIVVPPGDRVSADDTGVLWIAIGTGR